MTDKSKVMYEVSVKTTSYGAVRLEQVHDPESDELGIVLSAEHVPLVLEWMREAAGLPLSSVDGRKRNEVRAQAHIFRRLEPAAAGGPSDQGSAIEAIRVALEWAAGDSDLSPDEW